MYGGLRGLPDSDKSSPPHKYSIHWARCLGMRPCLHQRGDKVLCQGGWFCDPPWHCTLPVLKACGLIGFRSARLPYGCLTMLLTRRLIHSCGWQTAQSGEGVVIDSKQRIVAGDSAHLWQPAQCQSQHKNCFWWISGRRHSTEQSKSISGWPVAACTELITTQVFLAGLWQQVLTSAC